MSIAVDTELLNCSQIGLMCAACASPKIVGFRIRSAIPHASDSQFYVTLRELALFEAWLMQLNHML